MNGVAILAHRHLVQLSVGKPASASQPGSGARRSTGTLGWGVLHRLSLKDRGGRSLRTAVVTGGFSVVGRTQVSRLDSNLGFFICHLDELSITLWASGLSCVKEG